MTKKEFLRVVSCFLQDPEAIVANRNQVVFSNGDAEYSVELKVEDSEITEEFLVPPRYLLAYKAVKENSCH